MRIELDPEADDGLGQTSDDSSEASDQLDDGREHYQIVESVIGPDSRATSLIHI